MQLPSHLRDKNVENVMRLARDRRRDRSVQRDIAAHKVQLCEERMRTLREELLNADRDLRGVDDDIAGLRNLFLQTSAINMPSPGEGAIYESDDASSSNSDIST